MALRCLKVHLEGPSSIFIEQNLIPLHAVMNATGIFYRLKYSSQALVIMLTRYQIVESLSFCKSDTAIIPPFQLLSHIMNGSGIETKASTAPYGNCMLFTLFDVITRNCINQHLFICLQTHHGLRHVNLYFSTLYIDRNYFIRRIRLHIEAGSQYFYIK